MVKVLVHHAEIGLKGGNFSYFEKKLVENVRKICKKDGLSLKEIKRKDKKIFCEFDGRDSDSIRRKIKGALKCVFGVKYFAFVSESKKDIESIRKEAKRILLGMEEKEIAFKTKRGDKKFSMNSLEINKELGDIATSLGMKVNYKSDNILFIEIGTRVFMYTEKVEGNGGLPVGTSGRVLVLLSGGIDSPVAAWLAMKRGCRVDFLHFYANKNEKEVLKTKMKNVIETINSYQVKSKVYFIPYHLYEIESQGKVMQGLDLVVFKHYIMKVAEKIALEKKYDAIVTGDNLAQVASQTIENLRASSHEISVPILRPLITYDKQEIISLSKNIGMYDISIQKYKDCCSILSKKPSTKTKMKDFEREVKRIDIQGLVEKSLKESREVFFK
ncbi:MAG: tRNA uracil 4-sulfurtransferase ThiI [Candidatus Pacearchaeota archaeon]